MGNGNVSDIKIECVKQAINLTLQLKLGGGIAEITQRAQSLFDFIHPPEDDAKKGPRK